MASTRTLYTPAEVTAYSEHGKWYFKVIDAFGGALLDGGPFLSRTTALTVGKQEMAAMKAVKKNAGKKRTPKYAVSPQVLAALRLYQTLNGPQWKAELRDLWMRGHDVGLLRQARNQIGTGQLEGIDAKLAQLDTASSIAMLTADQIEDVQRVSRRRNAGKRRLTKAEKKASAPDARDESARMLSEQARAFMRADRLSRQADMATGQDRAVLHRKAKEAWRDWEDWRDRLTVEGVWDNPGTKWQPPGRRSSDKYDIYVDLRRPGDTGPYLYGFLPMARQWEFIDRWPKAKDKQDALIKRLAARQHHSHLRVAARKPKDRPMPAAAWDRTPRPAVVVQTRNPGKLSGRKRNPGTYYVLVYTKAGKHIETFGPYKLASAKSFARIGSQTGGPRQIRRGPRGRVVREYQGGERTYPKNTAQERGLTKAEKPKGAARPTKRSRGMRKAKLPRRNAGGYMHLVPAYGRDYKSAKAVKADWDAGKDFRINDMFDPDDGRLVNKEQVPHGVTIQIRYKKMTQLCVIKPGAKAERVVSALAKNTSKAEQVVGAMAGGWRKKKITVPMQSGESVELPAEVMGVWAVHRRAGHRGRASARVACTITHVPTGLAVLTVYDDPRTVIPRTRAKRFVETLVERNPDLLNEHDKDAIAKRVQAFKDVRSMLRMNPGKAAKGRGGQKLLPLAGPQRRNAGRLSGRKRNTASKASKVMGALSGKAAKGADPLKLTQKERTKVNKELHAAGLKYYSTKADLRTAVEDALSKAELVAEWPSDFGPVYADSGKQHHVEVAREWYGTLRNTTLTVNVYRMPSGNYELTAYLS